MTEKKYFGTDGIRGRAGVDPITPEFMLRLGRAIGRVLGDGNAKVLIGKDTRISGYMLESALEAGLVAVGSDVRLLGPMPTPAVAHLTRALGGTAGIVISASHNPYFDNGVKLFSAQGEKLDDAVELAIERELEVASAPHAPEPIGKAVRVDDAAQRYLAFCHRTVPGVDLRGKKIVVDCAHGATYHIAPKLLADLGADVIAIGVRPDGYNINQDCGATHLAALQRCVLENAADFGVAFDGDGDRVQMVDHTGAIVDGDDLLWILVSDRHESGMLRGPVVGTLMTNFGVERAITSLGVPFLRADVGDRYVLQTLKQHGGLLGGEASGHLLCLDKVSTGDGIVAALLVLEVLQRRGTTLAQARASLHRVPQTTLNIPASGGAALIARDAVQRALAEAQQTLSGRGRVVLRPSGTEPLVRVTVEGEDGAEVGALASALAEAVRSASESAMQLSGSARTMNAQIPTLDIRRYDSDRTAFVADLGAAYREWGFAGIRGHGIAQTLIDDAYDAFVRFFALPAEVKMKFHLKGTGGARGYTPFGIETAKDSRYPDLKEFWHIGRELPRDSKFADIMPPNVWPDEVTGFHEYGYALYNALDALGTRVLRALALHIDLPEHFFDDKTNVGNSILRPIHYPPITTPDIPNVRAGAHEDINFITLLVGASAAGLEVKSHKGEWVPFTAEADTIVVNIGDMLQRLTNHVYPSTTHRVVNPPGEHARKPRYSVPFFLHPNPDVVLDPLPSCITPDNPRRYDTSITSHEYLLERLREIKLI